MYYSVIRRRLTQTNAGSISSSLGMRPRQQNWGPPGHGQGCESCIVRYNIYTYGVYNIY